jgi:predicted TIM-barrel fold metal-dependent hydrolase
MPSKLLLPPRAPRLPLPLQRRSSDEYTPLPHHPKNVPVIARLRAEGPDHAARLSMSLGDYWTSRRGTAAALRALNEAWGGGFYDVPTEAALDRDAADAGLGGDQFVLDVQTHYTSGKVDAVARTQLAPALMASGEFVSGDLFQGLDRLAQTQARAFYSFAEYMRCVYAESDTTVAVLSSSPLTEGMTRVNLLDNSELIGTRELVERLSGTGRLINHCVVTPNAPGEIEMMDRWTDWCRPAGWKVYTQYGAQGEGFMHTDAPGWMLDDEATGEPFLNRVMESGVRTISAHKGLTLGPDQGWDGPSSPKDVGPAAKAFPGINFLIYHSGYEPRGGAMEAGGEDDGSPLPGAFSPRQGSQEEGPYTEETSHYGVNRLVKSLKDAGVGPNSNVYGEIGSTWYLIMAHPREAAHVLGKLLLAVGEDNILWGTDSIWYGSPQPLIDAFRAFQIPEEYRERYGYPQLTPEAKEKILGLNAARIYGIDPQQTLEATRKDDLSWLKAALEEYAAKGGVTTG